MAYKFSGLILEDPTSQEETVTVKPTSYTRYDFEIQEPDMVISKVSVHGDKERITQQAVFLVTQGQYYVQTIRGGKKEDPIVFNHDHGSAWIDKFSTFCRDISSDPKSEGGNHVPTGCNWLPYICKGRDFASALTNVFSNELSITLIKKNLYKFANNPDNTRNDLCGSTWDAGLMPFIMEEAAKLTSEEKVRTTIAAWNQNNYWREECDPQLGSLRTLLMDMYDRRHGNRTHQSFMSVMEERYGKSGIRDFLTSYLSVTNPYYGTSSSYRASSYSSPNIFDKSDAAYPERVFDLKKLTEYITYAPIHQAFSDLSTFLDIWNDTLDMEEIMYGKLKDKYPDYLGSVHDILSAKTALKRQQIDEKKFALHAEAEKQYRWAPSGGKYLITSPETSADIIDEATQQQNCLSSYVKPFSDNVTDIYFMRLQNDENTSLVTVEVYEGKLRQAFRARNQAISEEESKFLHKWADKFGFDASGISGSPLAAPIR